MEVTMDLDKFIVILRAKGYKITPQRRAMLSALLSCGKFPTALEVLEVIKKTNPDISLDTIYRNLNLLVELGLVHEIYKHGKDGNQYEIVVTGHHHHLICQACGKMECLHLCPLSDAHIEAAEASGFEVTGHMFEFYGKCRACKTKK